MKNYTITEDQIKELAKGNKKVEKMFPDVFEQKKEVGKWYFFKDNTGEYLYCLKENQTCYGFFRGIWTDKSWVITKSFLANSRKATEEEVKSALIEEAERRGFKSGAKFKSSISENGELRTAEEFRGNLFHFSFNDNELAISTSINEWTRFNSNPHIFKNGVWADIIKSKYYTKAQAEKRLTELENDGYEYEIID